MSEYDTQRPYLAAYIIIKKDNRIALVLRGEAVSWMPHMWGLPSGKTEKGESSIDAAVRELSEEAGIVVEPANLKPVHIVHRASEGEGEMTWIDVVFELTKWGQEPFNAEPHIHDSLEWFELDDLPENIIPSVKAMLDAYASGDRFSQYGW